MDWFLMLKKLAGEFIGTFLLLAMIVGSGIMATNISADVGVELMINVFSIISLLFVIILVFGPISGAHFNPIVTLSELFLKRIDALTALLYIVTQFLAATAGTIVANYMFNKPLIFSSHHNRDGLPILLGEVIATGGLLAIIALLRKQEKTGLIPIAIAAWIGSACFFTSSTSFANPAVTFARAWSDSFAGIAPHSVLPFICAQVIGAALGLIFAKGISHGK
jgi:glycerol uptake facilitator-like aquaporin